MSVNDYTQTNSSKTIKACLVVMTLAVSLASFAYFTKSTTTLDEHEYSVVQLSDMRRDQILIDKKTGRMWSPTCTGEQKGADCNADVVWTEISVVGLNGITKKDYYAYLQSLEDQKAQKNKLIAKDDKAGTARGVTCYPDGCR